MAKHSQSQFKPWFDRLPRRASGLLVYCSSILLIVAVVFGVFSVAYAGRIYPRVSVVDVPVGGLTPTQAKQRLQDDLAKQPINPVILTDGQGHSFTIKPSEAAVAINADQSVAAAMAVGRGPDWLSSLAQKITTPLFGLDLPAQVTLDEAKLDNRLKTVSDELTTPAKNADLVIKNGEVSISPPQTGQTIDVAVVKRETLAAFGRARTEPITILVNKEEPAIKEADLATAKKEAETILKEPIIFTSKQETFTATPAIIGGWLETKSLKALLKSKVELQFNEEKIDQYIANLAGKIDQEALNARLAISGGQVNIIQSSKDGLRLKREVAKADLVRLLTIRKEVPLDPAIASATPAESVPVNPTTTTTPVPTETVSSEPTPSPEIATNEVVLEVEVIKPDVSDANISSLGIKERMAVATTDFKTSPPNRQENIRIGTRLFNGILLKPGAQFSAVKSLGRIDASAGFKPELVIKQDQLTPEIGGGLCQVSTTLFRAVLNAGLKIDERRNHRFRVSYYEVKPSVVDPEDYVTLAAKTLVGLDATIYDPSPDFKFSNDTDNYVLIQGRVDGTRLTFELFGTKDGRKTTIDGPYITGTTPAPTEIQYIDDPTLPLGEIKVKEKPRAGAKANFTYIVTKDGKQIHKNTFGSSYVPWQAKSYRGTGPAASPSPSASPTADPSASPAVSPSPSPADSSSPSPSV